MNRKSNLSFGPGAASLILIFVMLTLSVLAMLSLMNARNDRVLSERNVSVVENVYALNAEAEETHAALDAVLAELADDAADDEEVLEGLQAVLLAAGGFEAGQEFTSVMDLFDSIGHSGADDHIAVKALSAVTALGESESEYGDFTGALERLGRLELDGNTVSWAETDGQNTLDCAMRILPAGGAARAEWIRYDLTAETAEAW